MAHCSVTPLPNTEPPTRREQLFLQRRGAHEFCRDYFQGFYDESVELTTRGDHPRRRRKKSSEGMMKVLSKELINDCFVAAASASGVGPRQAKMQHVGFGRVTVSQEPGDVPNTGTSRRLCLGFSEFVEFLVRVGLALCIAPNDIAASKKKEESMSRRQRVRSYAHKEPESPTLDLPAAFQDFLETIPVWGVSGTKPEVHKASSTLVAFTRSLLCEVLDVARLDAAEETSTRHTTPSREPVGWIREEQQQLLRAAHTTARVAASDPSSRADKQTSAPDALCAHASNLFVFVPDDEAEATPPTGEGAGIASRDDLGFSPSLQIARIQKLPRLADATSIFWQYFRPLDNSIGEDSFLFGGGTTKPDSFLSGIDCSAFALCTRTGALSSLAMQQSLTLLIRAAVTSL